jgi:hypothetical protein
VEIKIKHTHGAASFHGVPEPEPVTKLPKRQITHRDGTTTVTGSLATHESGPSSWNRSWEDSVRHPAGAELASEETPQAPSVDATTRKLNRRRTVGDRSTLYEPHTANRNPSAPLKPAGTFTPDND